MLKDIVIGLTVTAIPWAFIVALISSRMVINNWAKFRNWKHQKRSDLIKMSLWIATPLIMGTITWQNAVATSNYILAPSIPFYNTIQIIIYRQLFLIGVAAAMWYAFNAMYYPDYTFVDRLWTVTIAAGLLIGVSSFLLAYFF